MKRGTTNGGLLIFRHRNSGTFTNGLRLEVIEADNSDGVGTSVGASNMSHLYPGVNNNTSFFPTSIPNSNDVNGNPTGLSLTNFTNNNGVVSAVVDLPYRQSSTDLATAHNGGRRIVRDSSGNYHIVYQSYNQIFYTKYSATGIWSNDKRLSDGSTGNGFPSIALRGSSVFITWQRQNGSTHDVYFHRSTDSGATWPTGNRITWSGVGSSQPLPVVASPATNEVMVVYRSGGNLISKRSTNNGSSFTTTNTITGSALNSPSVAPAKNPSGSATTALAYATAEIPNASSILAQYYIPSPTNNWSGTFTLTNNLPGNLSQHAHPSIAFSGSSSNITHVAWDAYSSEVDVQSRVILHRKMSSWVVPSTYFKFELGFH